MDAPNILFSSLKLANLQILLYKPKKKKIRIVATEYTGANFTNEPKYNSGISVNFRSKRIHNAKKYEKFIVIKSYIIRYKAINLQC